MALVRLMFCNTTNTRLSQQQHVSPHQFIESVRGVSKDSFFSYFLKLSVKCASEFTLDYLWIYASGTKLVQI